MTNDNVRGGMGSVADAMGALMSGPLGKGLSQASMAAKAWYAANGDRERAHTTGVWLRKSGCAGVDPVMVVALDSNLLAMELGTNKELYLSRLAFRGVAVSDIKFTVGRGRTKDATPQGIVSKKRSSSAATTEVQPLPTLSPAEEERVDRATADLPDGLRQSVSRAMCASIRRSKSTGA